MNNKIIQNITFEMSLATPTMSYLWLDNADAPLWSPPEESVNKPTYGAGMRNDMSGLTVETNPFSFTFTDSRNSSNVLLHTKDSNFFMMDKYMQIDLQLPSQRIYGLGERNREFTLGEGTWTMWANGQETPYDDGTGGKQTYGVHPFALIQTAVEGEYMGIFFRNSNA